MNFCPFISSFFSKLIHSLPISLFWLPNLLILFGSSFFSLLFVSSKFLYDLLIIIFFSCILFLSFISFVGLPLNLLLISIFFKDLLFKSFFSSSIFLIFSFCPYSVIYSFCNIFFSISSFLSLNGLSVSFLGSSFLTV